MATNIRVADIPILRERFQIPPQSRLGSLRRVKEQVFTGSERPVFYEIAFERGLRFLIDDQARDLLVSLDFAPC